MFAIVCFYFLLQCAREFAYQCPRMLNTTEPITHFFYYVNTSLSGSPPYPRQLLSWSARFGRSLYTTSQSSRSYEVSHVVNESHAGASESVKKLPKPSIPTNTLREMSDPRSAKSSISITTPAVGDPSHSKSDLEFILPLRRRACPSSPEGGIPPALRT